MSRDSLNTVEIIESDQVGLVVDNICNNGRRDIRKVAGRLIEEVAELAAACGVTPAEMRGHLEDSIHNMCLKQSYADGCTVFPSQLTTNYVTDDVLSEAGDVLLLLKDVLWCTGNSQAYAEKRAYIKYMTLLHDPTSFVSRDGSTFYRNKDHVK